jgi:hypothetical protein
MRIFCRLLILCSLSLPAGVPATAQVLARPGWAGSGVTAEPWWRRAVFYRIDPARFQAVGDSPIGSIAGIAQRLPYLQRLGVDAIILTPQPPSATEAVADLVRSAGQFHLRVLVELPSADVTQARLWLNQGAAGLYLNPESPPSAFAARSLRQLADTYPGGRVLLASVPTGGAAHLTLTADVASVIPDAALIPPSTAVLRDRLADRIDTLNASDAPLLALTGTPSLSGTAAQQAIRDRTLAMILLASRAAILVDAGRELGLRSPGARPVLMQWTPSDLTQSKPAPEPTKPATPKAEVYGAYTPYVPPEKLNLPAPAMPVVVATVNAPPSDLNRLPGFTAGTLPTDAAANGSSANAAAEDADPSSLLNFYRHIIAIHHDDSTLRNGTQTVLDRDTGDALVWIRRAPAGSRTSASVIAAINLANQPVDLDLRSDLERLHMRPGTLRPLLIASTAATLASAGGQLPPESASHLTLPPSTLFLGELFHPDPAPTPTRHHHHS